MTDLPTTWQKLKPRLMQAGAGIMAIFYAYIQNDPDWGTQLGIPAALSAAILAILSDAAHAKNTDQAASALPVVAGKAKVEQLIVHAITEAKTRGDTALVDYLNKAEPKKPQAVEVQQ